MPNLPDLLISPLYLTSNAYIWNREAHYQGFQLKNRLLFLKLLVLGWLYPPEFKVRDVDLILLPADSSHLNQLIPISVQLKKRGIRYLWVSNKSKISMKLKEENEPQVFLRGFYTRAKLSDRRLSSEIRLRCNETLIGSPLNEVWFKTLTRNLFWTKSLLKFNEDLIAACKPKAVLVGNDLTMEGRIAASVFKKNQLLSYCVQHGDMSGLLESEHCVDEFYVYGDASYKQVQGYVCKSKFIVTGAPYLDSSPSAGNSSISRKLKLRTEKYILVAFSGHGDSTSRVHSLKLVEAIFELASIIPSIDFVIKLHPKDRIKNYETIQNNFPDSKIKIIEHLQPSFEFSIFEWLKGCSLLITGTSTTAIEAMYLGIPVITLDLMDEFKNVGFINAGATVHIRSKDGLQKVVLDILSNNFSGQEETLFKAREYSDRYFLKQGGTASETIVQEMIKNLNKKNG